MHQKRETIEDGLSDREYQIIVALSNGKTQPEIARDLFLAHDTVKTHTLRVRRRWGAKTTIQLIAMAIRHGFLEGHWDDEKEDASEAPEVREVHPDGGT